MPLEYTHDHENEITLFAETNYRNQNRRFGIKTDDRRRHMYVVGKTGMGKTTLLENLFYSDVANDHGCCYIDPHGDTAEKLVDFIPPHRINDVIYFNPADVDFPMGFNILETESEWQKPLVASGLMGVFKKIWPDVWSPRMEYILMNCVLALLDYPGATLLGINRLLVDKEYRTRVVAKIRDPIVKTFWVAEFPAWSEKYATEAIAPVQNKVGQFLSSSVIRNIVAQVKSTINLRRMMDDGKILIVNFSKGRIGEDNMRLLGGMLITKIQLAAQERQNILENERRDFYLYVDEFQNFANESFATILSEARKYRLNLIVAHQYIEQLDEKVRPAIFGNVGTIITMRVGGADAEAMELEFAPVFTPEDLANLAKAQIYLKLMVGGVATKPFSANTLPPIGKRTESAEKIIAVSRERYAEPRRMIEEKVLKWSGMEISMSLASGTPITPEGNEGDSEESETGAVHYPSIRSAEEQAADSDEDRNQIAAAAEHFHKEHRDTAEWDLEGEQNNEEYLMIRPERLAAISVSTSAGGGKKKDKPRFTHTCSRCGKTWDLPIQLDPSRPMYCPDCLPIIRDERTQMHGEVKSVMRSAPAPQTASASAPNRPRIVPQPTPTLARGTLTVVSGAPDDEEDELLGSLVQGGSRRPMGPSASPESNEERIKRSRKRRKRPAGAQEGDRGPGNFGPRTESSGSSLVPAFRSTSTERHSESRSPRAPAPPIPQVAMPPLPSFDTFPDLGMPFSVPAAAPVAPPVTKPTVPPVAVKASVSVSPAVPFMDLDLPPVPPAPTHRVEPGQRVSFDSDQSS